MASLAATKMLAKRIKKYLVFQSGTKVTEEGIASEKVLAARTSNGYHSRVDKLDFYSQEITPLFGPPPPGFLQDIALEVLRSSATPSALYALFKNLKSKF